MLKQRVLVAAVLLPVGIWLIFLGGIFYLLVVAFFMVAAVWEYAGLFAALGRQPVRWLMVLGALAFIVARFIASFRLDAHVLAAVTLVTLLYHMVEYERGAPESATDFAISLSGMVYVGFVGAYMVSLRQLSDGAWWVLLALPVIWVADSAAYFAGKAWGKRKLSPRLSPKKTWEGYLAGVVAGTLTGALLAFVYPQIAGRALSEMTVLNGTVLGALISIIAPLGDLAESLFKRQAGIKDSGRLLPGHGGAFDRVDSWLWAGIIAFYFLRLVA